jgi:hypothetical protein
MKKRISGTCATLVVTAALALSTTSFGSTANAATGGSTLAKTKPTQFAFLASGYGSRAIGGQIPVGSSTSAYEDFSCTNVAGKDKTNNVAAVTVPGLGTVTGMSTHVWSQKTGGVASSYATHSIADIELAGAGALGSLSITGLSSQSRAFHDSSGYHATATTDGKITFTPPAPLPPQSFPLPSPGKPITIPGLATIYAGKTVARNDANAAEAYAVALSIQIPGSGSMINLAKSRATIAGGLRYGTFSGHSDAIRVTNANTPSITSGRNPLSKMPCQGTLGQVKQKAIAGINLGGQVVVNGLASEQSGKQSIHRARGYEKGTVASVNIGNQLVINGIVGQVNVDRRDGHKIHRNTVGTTIGSITANGQVMTFPATQNVITIPGVATLERNVKDRGKTGVSIIALRITLLGGTAGVIDLGEASLHISKLKRR